MRSYFLAAAAVLSMTALAGADSGMTKGTPDIKSVSALAFGPGGILFIGDPQAATVFAVDTGDVTPAGDKPVDLQRIDAKIAGMVGTTEKALVINDVKVNPASGNVYIAVTRGANAGPAFLKLTRGGELQALVLKDVSFSKMALPNAPTGGKQRAEVITSLGFVDGKLIVAGLSNEEFASTLRLIPFPFKETITSAGVQIFHGAHGNLETKAPVRTFTPYKIDGVDYVMAAYTCTPLVKIPLADLKSGAKVKGVTIAELGNRNKPLDMIVYTKGGKDYILMANSARGVMKIPTEGAATIEAISAPVKSGTAGMKYETIGELKNVMHLDKLDDARALLLVKTDAGFDLKTIPLP